MVQSIFVTLMRRMPTEEPDAERDTELLKRIMEFAIQIFRARSQPNTWACFE